MTHPNFRRNGIGRLLMQKAEERAKQENRSLCSARYERRRPFQQIV